MAVARMLKFKRHLPKELVIELADACPTPVPEVAGDSRLDPPFPVVDVLLGWHVPRECGPQVDDARFFQQEPSTVGECQNENREHHEPKHEGLGQGIKREHGISPCGVEGEFLLITL